jgi:beta-galactosidase
MQESLPGLSDPPKCFSRAVFDVLMHASELRENRPILRIFIGAPLISRIAAVFIFCFALIFHASAQAPTNFRHDEKRNNFFPVAVWYSGGKARAPMLEPIVADSERRWNEDLQKIKGLGFNTVRTWVEWNVGEPREGEYHLENLDLLLRLAEKNGLKVIVQMYVDSAPEWVGQKFPDGHYAAQDGQPIPSQAAPGYCFDHRGVRHAVLKFMEEVARHAESSPAFYGYDLWSEPAALNWARVGYKASPMFCYCPSSMDRFRTWLKAKYGTLEKLNAAWHRTFTDWKQVEPPRYGTILTYTDFMDWRVYYGNKLAEDLKARNEAVKSVDPSHVTSSHAPNPSPLVRTLADPYDPTDDFLMKDSVDYYGTSFYPKLTSPDRNWTLQRRVLAMDLTRAITGDRGFFVGELQSGYGVHGTIVGSEITPNDLEMWTWGMIARGARAISYYAFYPMNAGYESGGYGMINLDGTLTERSRRAGATAKTIEADAAALLASKPKPAEVAIIFNPLTPLVGGYDEAGSRTRMHQSVAGYHRMFFERNIPVDVLSSRELSQKKLGEYKLVVVPYPLMMTKEEAGELREYVAGGGHLFTEARPGWVDENGHAEAIVPGFGWEQMLGVREKSLVPGEDFTVKWGGTNFKGAGLQERFEVVDSAARAVAAGGDDSTIAYEHKYRKGEAIIFGGFAGQANYTSPVERHPLGEILVRWAGIQTPKLEANGRVELREMVSSTGHIVMIFNHEGAAAKVKFTEKLERQVGNIQELVTGSRQDFQGDTFSIEAEIPGESVRVYRIAYQTQR